MALREPTRDEMRLLGFLALIGAGRGLSSDCLIGVRVEDMTDGGMGSLRLWPRRMRVVDKVAARTIAACQFSDLDGVPVIASLYVNREGVPFELDAWKVDFSPLRRIPDEFVALHEPERR